MYTKKGQIQQEAKVVESTNQKLEQVQKKDQDDYQNLQKNPNFRKLFISQISTLIPDSLIEVILQQCGEIGKWSRNIDADGKLVSFGIVEFKDVEGIMKCMRLLQGYDAFGQQLLVKMSGKVKRLIAAYVDYLKKEIQKKEGNLSEKQIEEKLNNQFSSSDEKILKKIALYFEKFGINKDNIVNSNIKSSTEKYTQEKLILQKKKYGLINDSELTDMFHKELEDWLDQEQRQIKQRQFEIEDAENLYQMQRDTLSNELNYKDSLKYTYDDYQLNEKNRRDQQWQEDKKYIQKQKEEMEEDRIDKQEELKEKNDQINQNRENKIYEKQKENNLDEKEIDIQLMKRSNYKQLKETKLIKQVKKIED